MQIAVALTPSRDSRLVSGPAGRALDADFEEFSGVPLCDTCFVPGLVFSPEDRALVRNLFFGSVGLPAAPPPLASGIEEAHDAEIQSAMLARCGTVWGGWGGGGSVTAVLVLQLGLSTATRKERVQRHCVLAIPLLTPMWVFSNGLCVCAL